MSSLDKVLKRKGYNYFLTLPLQSSSNCVHSFPTILFRTFWISFWLPSCASVALKVPNNNVRGHNRSGKFFNGLFILCINRRLLFMIYSFVDLFFRSRGSCKLKNNELLWLNRSGAQQRPWLLWDMQAFVSACQSNCRLVKNCPLLLLTWSVNAVHIQHTRCFLPLKENTSQPSFRRTTHRTQSWLVQR